MLELKLLTTPKVLWLFERHRGPKATMETVGGSRIAEANVGQSVRVWDCEKCEVVHSF